MKKRKIIKFWNWSMLGFADLAENLDRITKNSPKYFMYIWEGSSDYVIAYSNDKFSYKEALKAYSRNKENGVSYKELLELNKD